MRQALEGGCFCGAVRFRINGLVDSAVHCHCEFCRRSVGAPLVTWVTVRRDEIEWSGAAPRAYRHRSDWLTPIVRRFCGECGTSLTYEREGSEDLDVTAVSATCTASASCSMSC